MTSTSPLLLFPAISLLLLAYTNRFNVIAGLTRSLYVQYRETADDTMRSQIEHLRLRIRLIRHMQLWGIGAFISCTLAMIILLIPITELSLTLFAISLVSLIISLFICFFEVYISGYALNKQLENLGRLHE
ncbi:II family cellulose-binding protein [Catenovulum maritimum]|uniref:II family cellulose-binding protein n=2 Tax=Catenovulum maritimum TaxID=1513271 RepID=A0A0J8GM53_9ALTE|nr:II family cellulose-binding protein [Catenovulum maritimum]